MAKKAKDWAMEFETTSNLVESVQKFVGEIGEVAQARGGSLNAMEGAVREQRAKFDALCRLCPKMAGQKFDQLLAEFGKDFQKAENKYRQNLERRKNPQKPQQKQNEGKRQPRGEKQ